MESQAEQCLICRHIRISGRRCQSPALAGSAFCFYHRTLHRSHRAASTAHSAPLRPETVQYLLENGVNPAQFNPCPALDLPPLEDAESVQLAISLLFAAIAAHQIERTHAHTLLYALQIASSNLRALHPVPASDSDCAILVRSVVRSRGGQPLAALGDGNGVPSQPERPESALELFQNEHSGGPVTPPSDPVKHTE